MKASQPIVQLLLRTVVAGLLVGRSPVVARAATGDFGALTEYSIPTADSEPGQITLGSDGNLWFTEGSQIGRITPSGSITEYALPTPVLFPLDITAGPDGNLWFTVTEFDTGTSALGRITTSGVVVEFPLSGVLLEPCGIASGSDGNLWLTQCGGLSTSVARRTLSGALTKFPLPKPEHPKNITAGPNGSLWFTEPSDGQIGRITTGGEITEFSVPALSSDLGGITSGSDGNVWFTESGADQIGRITPAGLITEFPIPTESSRPGSIALGPDGALWFTESDAGRIGRITTAGEISEFILPAPGGNPSAYPQGIAAGPDGAIWFTEPGSNKIGRLALSTAGPCTPSAEDLCLLSSRFKVSVNWIDQHSGELSGTGTTLPLSDGSGSFWFFRPDWAELTVKLIDGRGTNGKFWFFYGALSDLEYTITVTDTTTGTVRTYHNDPGNICGGADTKAF